MVMVTLDFLQEMRMPLIDILNRLTSSCIKAMILKKLGVLDKEFGKYHSASVTSGRLVPSGDNKEYLLNKNDFHLNYPITNLVSSNQMQPKSWF